MKVAQFQDRLMENHGNHARLLDKALMHWGNSDDNLLLHTVYRVWADYLAEVAEAKKVIQFQNKMIATDGNHAHLLDKALMHWGSSDKNLLLHTVFRVWTEYTAEEREGRKVAQFQDRLMENHGYHDRILDKALMHWGSSDDNLLLHTVYRVWADYLAEAKDARKVAQFQDHLMETHGNHDRILDKAL